MPELIPAAPLTPEWHAARRAGVTATDIVTILGLSSWDSVYSLFWRKMGQVPDEPDNDRMRLGRELERYIWDRWYEVTGDEDEHTYPAGLWRSLRRPWQMATLDALYKARPVELKSWADADRHTWQDRPPARVRAQVLWQMDVMDVAAGHVGVVFLPSGEFRSYTIEHDHTMSGPLDCCPACDDLALMRAAGEKFMARLRLELPPPDPDSSAATLAAVRARFARQPAKQAEISQEIFDAWDAAKRKVETWTERARECETNLREQAGEASVLCVDGQPVARRVIVDAQVKAHTRHQDYLKRIKQGEDSVD